MTEKEERKKNPSPPEDLILGVFYPTCEEKEQLQGTGLAALVLSHCSSFFKEAKLCCTATGTSSCQDLRRQRKNLFLGFSLERTNPMEFRTMFLAYLANISTIFFLHSIL